MIAFAGLTHLGLIYSAATAAKGFSVLGFDSRERIDPLREGKLPIAEPGLEELFANHRPALQFSDNPADLRAAELLFFSADIPTDEHNQSNLQPLHDCLEEVLPKLPPGTPAVLLSQVPPGFTRAARTAFQGRIRQLALYYQVETLVFGNAVQRALLPERYMVGCFDPRQPLPAAYNRWLEAFSCPILKMRYESAELSKIAINLFLVSSVTTTNLLAELSEQIGADWFEVVPALRLDARIGPKAYLSPGLGLAGGNLERDLMTIRQLCHDQGTEGSLIGAWQMDSSYRRDWVLRKTHELLLAQQADPIFAIWGLAYKAGTHSTKNSPALALLEALAPFETIIFDPRVPWPDTPQHRRSRRVNSPLDACRNADALLVMTPWPEFAQVPPDEVRMAMRGRVIIDPFGALPHEPFEQAGFSCHRLGVNPISQSSL